MFKKIEEKWSRDFLLYEFYFSIVITLFCIITVNIFDLIGFVQNILDGIRSTLYATIAQIAGSLLGFVIAGVSILLTMQKNENMKILECSNLYYQIFDVFISGSKILSVTTVIALLSMVFDNDKSYNYIFMYGTLWGIIISSFRTWRCLWILKHVIDLQIKKKSLKKRLFGG